MALYFRNQTNQSVSVAIGYHWPNCPDGDNWAKKGWWVIAPGQTATVRGGASKGAKYFWHAHTSGGLQWSGEFLTNLPTGAHCRGRAQHPLVLGGLEIGCDNGERVRVAFAAPRLARGRSNLLLAGASKTLNHVFGSRRQDHPVPFDSLC